MPIVRFPGGYGHVEQVLPMVWHDLPGRDGVRIGYTATALWFETRGSAGNVCCREWIPLALLDSLRIQIKIGET